ncbi:HlyD family secretion protein [Bradyrhizobium sp. CW11]|uniref:HlyD family secretion protein n=1 Tax=Bradyrhizobium sp. CW11 TaxID=2782684 RepID=UPI003211F138
MSWTASSASCRCERAASRDSRAGTPIAQILDPTDVFVDWYVPNERLSDPKVGNEVFVLFGNRRILGEIVEILPVSDVYPGAGSSAARERTASQIARIQFSPGAHPPGAELGRRRSHALHTTQRADRFHAGETIRARRAVRGSEVQHADRRDSNELPGLRLIRSDLVSGIPPHDLRLCWSGV